MTTAQGVTQITEVFESADLYDASADFSVSQASFTYDNNLNFGYGLNLHAAAGNPTLQAEITSVLMSSLGVNLAPYWSNIQAGLDVHTTLNGLIPAGTTTAQVQNVANTLTQFYLDNVNLAPASLTSALSTGIGLGYYPANPTPDQILSNVAIQAFFVGHPGGIDFTYLPTNIQNALLSLTYPGVNNIGPNLLNDLYQGEVTGDYSQAAYEIAFNTTSGNPVSAHTRFFRR